MIMISQKRRRKERKRSSINENMIFLFYIALIRERQYNESVENCSLLAFIAFEYLFNDDCNISLNNSRFCFLKIRKVIPFVYFSF